MKIIFSNLVCLMLPFCAEIKKITCIACILYRFKQETLIKFTSTYLDLTHFNVVAPFYCDEDISVTHEHKRMCVLVRTRVVLGIFPLILRSNGSRNMTC